MKKQITIALFIAVLIGVYQTGCADGQGEQDGSGTKTTMQTTKFEDAQGDCANGGVKIEVLVDGTVDDTQTQYICNGINGQGEQNGTNTSIQTTKFEDAQGDCANGGVKIEVSVDGTVDDTQTQYLCNGAQGLAGSSTKIQATPFEDAQGDCTNGGVKIEVLVDGTVDDTQTQYICHGVNGHDGKDGQNSYQALVMTSNDVGTNCAHGGIRIDSGVDKNNNNTLETSEILSTRYVCNGANGADGQNGQDGTNGTNGKNASIQTTTFVGALGSCTNGGVKVEVLMDGVVQAGQTQYLCNGANGQNGQDGQNGADGQNGHNALVATSNETAGMNCAHGGIRLDSGVDKNNNNTLETSEILSTRYICNGANGADGQNGQDGTNGTNASIQTTPFDGAQGSCTNGGVKIEVLMDGVVQAGQTQYLCNGVNGADGQDGQNGADGQNGHNALVATSNENAGANCTHGGIRIDSGVDTNNNNTLESTEIVSTRYICNGANGADGQDGTNGTNASIQTTPFVGAQGSCTNGGVKIEVLVDGVVQTGQTQYLCNGADGQDGQDGQNGADGQNGHNALVATSNENAGTNCAHGGIRIDSGVDKNNNNTLETSEILSTRYVCNGANGADGQDGTNGMNGTNASIQTTPFEGVQGSCINGGVKIEVLMDGVVQAGQTQYICNGANGADGQDGQNGADGQNGHNALVATSNETAGTNCAHGGIRIDSGVDKNNNNTLETSEILSTRYVCNGANGVDGTDGQNGTNGTNATIHTTPFDGSQGSCTNGGVKVEVLVDGVVQAEQTQYICNGANSNGTNGANACLTDNDCQQTAYCDQTFFLCVDKIDDGESCTQANQCISNLCIGYKCGAVIGDIVTFGHYEQDNNTTNGKEPIEWRVLDKSDEGQILIISNKVLDVISYNTTDISITWEKSTIRSWLNGYAASYNTVGTNFTSDNFIDAAFNTEEQTKIISSHVPAHANPSYNISQGNATTDKIFLLSIVEANNYFRSNAARKADATRYAVKKGVHVNGSQSGTYTHDGTCTDVHCYAMWWLRTPARSANYAASINYDGSVSTAGYIIYHNHDGVRPALWVKY